MKPSLSPPLVLAACCLALAAGLYVVVMVPSDPPTPTPLPSPMAAQDQTSSAPPAPVAQPPAILADLAARPLFTPSRRPKPVVTPAAAAVAPPPPPPLALTLLGTLVAPNANLAIIRTAGAPSPRNVALGQAIDGWVVADIQPHRLLLRNGSVEHEYTQPRPSQMGGTAQAPFIPINR